MLRTFAQGEGSGFYRELLSGLQDVASARPGFVLRQIARTAREEPEVAEQLRVAELSELTVAGLPAGRTREALRRFLEDYGYRGIREAEIAAPRWSEDPTLMFAALRSHLGSRTDVDDRDRDLRRARQEAEDKLRKSVPFPLRPSVTKLLEVVQRFTRMREHLRGHVVEVLGMFRRIALEASRRIEAREPEAGPDAAFFLTLRRFVAFCMTTTSESRFGCSAAAWSTNAIRRSPSRPLLSSGFRQSMPASRPPRNACGVWPRVAG